MVRKTDICSMDLLSHALVGAAIGEGIVGKRIGRRGMVLGAVTALLPDLDAFGHFFLSNADQLAFHRGITHSLLFAALLALLLARVFRRWFSAAEIHFVQWISLFGLSLLSHLFLDILTCYGTGLLEPFSHHRVSLDTIFVADPFFTLPMLASVSIVLIGYRNPRKRRWWNLAGLGFGAAYLAFTCLNHLHVHTLMSRAFAAKGLSSLEFTVTPTPMNNLLWMAYSRDSTGAWIGYHSLLDPDESIDFHRLERNDSLLAPFESDPALAVLRRFSKGNYAVTQHGNHLYFNDLRFGQVSSWDSLDSEFAMRYDFGPGADNSRPLNRMRFSEPKLDVFWELVHRVRGK
jgi:inner membrane protein